MERGERLTSKGRTIKLSWERPEKGRKRPGKRAADKIKARGNKSRELEEENILDYEEETEEEEEEESVTSNEKMEAEKQNVDSGNRVES